jgi:hypothetical protein
MQVILNHYFNIYYMIFTFKDFTNKLKEHAVYDLDLSEFDNYLYDPSKKTTKSLVLLMNLTFRLPLFNI